MQYFVKRNKKIHGPFSLQQIRSGIESGKLTTSDLVATTQQGPWQPADGLLKQSESPDVDDEDVLAWLGADGVGSDAQPRPAESRSAHVPQDSGPQSGAGGGFSRLVEAEKQLEREGKRKATPASANAPGKSKSSNSRHPSQGFRNTHLYTLAAILLGFVVVGGVIKVAFFRGSNDAAVAEQQPQSQQQATTGGGELPEKDSTVAQAPPSLARSLVLAKLDQRNAVVSVTPQSRADEAGLQVGDVVLEVNGEKPLTGSLNALITPLFGRSFEVGSDLVSFREGSDEAEQLTDYWRRSFDGFICCSQSPGTTVQLAIQRRSSGDDQQESRLTLSVATEPLLSAQFRSMDLSSAAPGETGMSDDEQAYAAQEFFDRLSADGTLACIGNRVVSLDTGKTFGPLQIPIDRDRIANLFARLQVLQAALSRHGIPATRRPFFSHQARFASQHATSYGEPAESLELGNLDSHFRTAILEKPKRFRSRGLLERFNAELNKEFGSLIGIDKSQLRYVTRPLRFRLENSNWVEVKATILLDLSSFESTSPDFTKMSLEEQTAYFEAQEAKKKIPVSDPRFTEAFYRHDVYFISEPELKTVSSGGQLIYLPGSGAPPKTPDSAEDAPAPRDSEPSDIPGDIPSASRQNPLSKDWMTVNEIDEESQRIYNELALYYVFQPGEGYPEKYGALNSSTEHQVPAVLCQLAGAMPGLILESDPDSNKRAHDYFSRFRTALRNDRNLNLPHEPHLEAIRISPDKRFALGGLAGARIGPKFGLVWDLASMDSAPARFHWQGQLMYFDSNYVVSGETLLADDGGLSESKSARIRVVSWRNPSQRGTFLVEGIGSLASAAISPDQRLLAVSGASPFISLIDLSTGKELFTLEERASALAFSGDGKELVSANGTGVFVWSLAKKSLLARYSVDGGKGAGSGYLKDKLVLSAQSDGSFEIKNKKELKGPPPASIKAVSYTSSLILRLAFGGATRRVAYLDMKNNRVTHYTNAVPYDLNFDSEGSPKAGASVWSGPHTSAFWSEKELLQRKERENKGTEFSLLDSAGCPKLLSVYPEKRRVRGKETTEYKYRVISGITVMQQTLEEGGFGFIVSKKR